MSRDDLNWWLTLVANAGVIAGLVFLGYEIQQNTVQLRADASHSITESMNAMNAGVYGDTSLAELLLNGEKDYLSLSEAERKKFAAFQFSRINLAIYILDLESEGMKDVNIQYVDYIVKEFRSQPGLHDFIVDMKSIWAGSDEFYRRLSGQE